MGQRVLRKEDASQNAATNSNELSSVMEAMWQRLEAKLDTNARLERLERQVASWQGPNGDTSVASWQGSNGDTSEQLSQVPHTGAMCNSTDPTCPMLAKTYRESLETLIADI